MKNLLLFMLFSSILFFFVSCSNENDTPAINSYSVSTENNSTLLIGGRTSSITITANYSDGTTKNVNHLFVWSSSNTSVASVDNGEISVANGEGNVTINFETKEKLPNGETLYADSISFEIKASVLQSLLINPVANISKGSQKTLTATGYFDYVLTDDISSDCNWTSSDETILAVTNNGNTIQALNLGSANITATDKNSGKSDTITITVVESAYTKLSITIPTDTTLNAQETLQLQTIAINSLNEQIILSDDVTWSSSDTKIMEVNSTGVVTAKAKGTATITAAITNLNISDTLSLDVDKEVWLQITNNATGKSGEFPYVKDYNLTQDTLETNLTLASYTLKAIGKDFTFYNMLVTDLNGQINDYAGFYIDLTQISYYTLNQDDSITIELRRVYTSVNEYKFYFSLEPYSITNFFSVTFHN